MLAPVFGVNGYFQTDSEREPYQETAQERKRAYDREYGRRRREKAKEAARGRQETPPGAGEGNPTWTGRTPARGLQTGRELDNDSLSSRRNLGRWGGERFVTPIAPGQRVGAGPPAPFSCLELSRSTGKATAGQLFTLRENPRPVCVTSCGQEPGHKERDGDHHPRPSVLAILF